MTNIEITDRKDELFGLSNDTRHFIFTHGTCTDIVYCNAVSYCPDDTEDIPCNN